MEAAGLAEPRPASQPLLYGHFKDKVAAGLPSHPRPPVQCAALGMQPESATDLVRAGQAAGLGGSTVILLKTPLIPL